MTSENMTNARRNIGGLNSRDIPRDRYIVAGAFILMDDDGNHTVYFQKQAAMAGYKTSPLPTDEVLLELAGMLAAAWDIAGITGVDTPEYTEGD